MARTHVNRSFAVSSLVLSAVIGASAVSAADQILVINDHTLTTYRASATNVSGAQPLVKQRGVHLDGTMRSAPTHPMALAGNPFGESWNSKANYAGMMLDTGTFAVNAVDMALPAPGFRWVIGRTYNVRQWTGSAYIDSDGPQGINWSQTSQPELLYYDANSDAITANKSANDTVYLVYGADRYIEFRRYSTIVEEETVYSDDTFRAVNGAAGVIVWDEVAEGPDLWTYYDPRGYSFTFFGIQGHDDADITNAKEGQLWKITDPADNIAHVGSATGDATNASNALSTGYDANGQLLYAIDTADRRYDYAYTTLDSVDRLTSVTVKEWGGSSWDATGDLVEYDYYRNTMNTEDSFGSPGDLRLVTVTVPMTVTSDTVEYKTYYRYYTDDTYHVDNNPGNDHHLQYIFEAEGLRKWDYVEEGDSSLDEGFLVAHITNDDLKQYASSYFEYEDDNPGGGAHRRVIKAWFNGECGCGTGGTNGLHLFEYETNGSYSDGSGYDNTWSNRTIITGPEIPNPDDEENPFEVWTIQYFDEGGQPLGHVLSDDDPDTASNFWATYVVRGTGGLSGSEADGLITAIHTPANITTYDHDNSGTNGEFVPDQNVGLIVQIERMDTLSYPALSAVGFPKEYSSHEGTDDTNGEPGGSTNYTCNTEAHGDLAFALPNCQSASCAPYPVTFVNLTNDATIIDIVWWTSPSHPLVPQVVTATYPDITAGNNGSGTSNSESHYFELDGTNTWSKSSEGIITYREYTNGLLTKLIEDADTSQTGTPPTGFSSSGTPFHRTTTYTYDDRGRLKTMTMPDGRVLRKNYSHLADGRLITLDYPDYVDDTTDSFYGPVSFSVTNQVGQIEASGSIELDDGESTTIAIASHIDETESDPLLAINNGSNFGTVVKMTTYIYNESGTQVQETRAYDAVPGSGVGTTANYEPTLYAYDDRGRQVRTETAAGTIHRVEYDVRDNVIERSIGTDDSSGGGNNMVVTEELVYDGGSAGGNGHLTQRSLDPDGTPRETLYTYNYKGQLLLQTNPQSPHIFNEYNTKDQLIAVGQYGDLTDVSVTADTPRSEQSGRIGLVEYSYDELGRRWKTSQKKIIQSSGAIAQENMEDVEIVTELWRDKAGRVVKTHGGEYSKSRYDRLGRMTHRFVLASDDDSTYANALAIDGDIVMEEYQTLYESGDSDDVIMTASIMRLWNDRDTGSGETTGALDTNADGDLLIYTASNIKGRIQITANWYDRFGRLTETVNYGTKGFENGSGTTYDRDGQGAPTRPTSSTDLMTEYVYTPDGDLFQVIDPRELETRYTYDDLGRQLTVVSNYDDNTPGGTNGDEDQTITYVYSAGHLTSMTANLPGGNQTTTYTYGVTTSQTPASELASNDLLVKVTYPDDQLGGGSDRGIVEYAYNALGEQIAMEDQNESLIDIAYDVSGRVVSRAATATGAGVDAAVLRIEYAYDNRGLLSTVTQYDDDSAGNVVDQVKFTYDDWGPVSKFEQDHNSTVASGAPQLYDVEYTYERGPTGADGRRAIRKTSMTLSSSNVITYTYLSSSGRHDDALSRVSQVKDGGVENAQYWYNGMNHLVGTIYPEADVQQLYYSTSTPGTFPQLDRFNRPTTDRWEKILGGGNKTFYETAITWDVNSNITLIEDNVHTGRDVDYTIDDLNRLTKAEEGTWSSGITSRTRQEIWTLDQAGNWDLFRRDLDGNGAFTGTDELDDDRTHNIVNELTARDIDDSGSDDYTLVHDENGNLTDDNEAYKFEYDAFNRLRKVKNQSDTLIAEYRYNGLNYRITSHQDTDTDGDVDGNDIVYHFVYDPSWRIVAIHENSGTAPVQEFVHHNAGMDGNGSASYIDDVIFRDRDNDISPDLEERTYFCQNWRHDVVALVTDTGELLEQIRYSSYGVPFAYPAGDTDSDGDWDATDSATISFSIAYGVRKDPNLDGIINASDITYANSITGGYQTLGWKVITSTAINNFLGYAGYVHDAKVGQKYHVRNRVLDSELGRWITRDPMEYEDGASLVQYVSANPLGFTDRFGLCKYCDPSLLPAGPGRPIPPMPDKWADDCGCTTTYPPPGNERLRQACRNGCWYGDQGLNCQLKCREVYSSGSALYNACVSSCEGARGGNGATCAVYKCMAQPFSPPSQSQGFWEGVNDGYFAVCQGAGEVFTFGCLPDDWVEPMQFNPNDPILQTSETLGACGGAGLGILGSYMACSRVGIITVDSNRTNLIRIISKPLRCGFRIDRPDLHKPFHHPHLWQWWIK